jgi:hypothetical protein
MGLSITGLRQVLFNNVVELKFARRNPVPGRAATRRMLASLNPQILDSELGRSIFNFKPSVYSLPYNAAALNLLVVFDLFMQDWRAIPVNSTEIIRILPSSPVTEFWKYFNEVLSKMTSAQKAAFMEQ